jgi:hypothetical protein
MKENEELARSIIPVSSDLSGFSRGTGGNGRYVIDSRAGRSSGEPQGVAKTSRLTYFDGIRKAKVKDSVGFISF